MNNIAAATAALTSLNWTKDRQGIVSPQMAGDGPQTISKLDDNDDLTSEIIRFLDPSNTDCLSVAQASLRDVRKAFGVEIPTTVGELEVTFT